LQANLDGDLGELVELDGIDGHLGECLCSESVGRRLDPEGPDAPPARIGNSVDLDQARNPLVGGRLRQSCRRREMAAGLPIVIVAVLTLFGVFMAGLGYAAWSTRGMVLATPAERHPKA
jgi:hypothetical protein